MAAATSQTNNDISLYTTPKFNIESRHTIIDYIDRLESMLIDTITTGLSINQGGHLYRLTAADIRPALFASTRARGGVEFCIRNILLESTINLEKTSGFAALVSVISSIQTIKSNISSLHLNNKVNLPDIHTQLSHLARSSRKASKSQAFKAIMEYCKDPLASSIIIQACSMTGHSGQVYVDNTPAARSSIELTNGYTFNFGVEPNFLYSSKIKEWKSVRPSVILIDGIIETVGEINRVLEYCNSEKLACMIFARGFSEEVLGTLAVNKSRETLDVIPVAVPFDLEGINSLVDLAAICGCDIISSLKGDLISAIEPSELPKVDSINAQQDQIVIVNKKTEHIVQRQVSNIIEKRNKETVTDKVDLLNKRLRTLSSVCTHVRIAGDDLRSKNTKVRVQHGINMLKHICRYGCINLYKLPAKDISSPIVKAIDILKEAGYNDVSSKEFLLGLRTGHSIAENILSAAVYLVLDENNKDR